MIGRKKVNLDYFRLLKELVLFCELFLLKKKKTNSNLNRVLIVNPCLIGEFVASITPIFDYIQRHPEQVVDLVVAPSVKELAEKIVGVNKVYIARSVHGRTTDEFVMPVISFEYKKIIVLRTSPEANKLIKNLAFEKIETGFWNILVYGLHLFKKMVQRRKPKQWTQVNSEILGGENTKHEFNNIFCLEPADFEKLKQFEILDSQKKKILIHTWANWPMKTWSREAWVELLKAINSTGEFEYIFVGTKEDEDYYKYISEKLDFKVHSLIGKISLVDLLLVMRTSDYFIGIDSGPQNIAQLAGIKSVVIFGMGPHMYLPTNANSLYIDKSRGRGLYQMFFIKKKNSIISKVRVHEVLEAFKKVLSL